MEAVSFGEAVSVGAAEGVTVESRVVPLSVTVERTVVPSLGEPPTLTTE